MLVDLLARIDPLKGTWTDRRERLGRIGAGVWAMNLAHLGVAIVALGAAGAGALRTERIVFMTEGAGVTLPGGRQVRLVEVEHAPGPNYAAERALFEVRKGRGAVQTLTAERRYYPVRDTETAEAGIVTGAGGDVYVTVGLRRDERGWPVSASFFPFTIWLWIGSALAALGGALAMLDHARAAARERAAVQLPPKMGAAPAPAE